MFGISSQERKEGRANNPSFWNVRPWLKPTRSLIRNHLSNNGVWETPLGARSYLWNSPSRARNAPHNSSLLRRESTPRFCNLSEDIDFGIVGGVSEDKWVWDMFGNLSVEKAFGIEGTSGIFGSAGAFPRKALSGRLGFLPTVEPCLARSLALPFWIGLFADEDGDGRAWSNLDLFSVVASSGVVLFLGEGEREAVLHDFLAKFDSDPETERELRPEPTRLAPFSVSRAYVAFPSYCVASLYFEIVILGLFSERVDECTPTPVSKVPDFSCSKGCRDTPPCRLARAFSERVRLIPWDSGETFKIVPLEMWSQLADRWIAALLLCLDSSEVQVGSLVDFVNCSSVARIEDEDEIEVTLPQGSIFWLWIPLPSAHVPSISVVSYRLAGMIAAAILLLNEWSGINKQRGTDKDSCTPNLVFWKTREYKWRYRQVFEQRQQGEREKIEAASMKIMDAEQVRYVCREV